MDTVLKLAFYKVLACFYCSFSRCVPCCENGEVWYGDYYCGSGHNQTTVRKLSLSELASLCGEVGQPPV
jgi:hypothetical protein